MNDPGRNKVRKARAMAYIKDNILIIILTILLTLLISIGGYFVKRVEGHEGRLRDLEIQCPENTNRIIALKEAVKLCNDNLVKLNEANTVRNRAIIERLNGQLFILERLLESSGGK